MELSNKELLIKLIAAAKVADQFDYLEAAGYYRLYNSDENFKKAYDEAEENLERLRLEVFKRMNVEKQITKDIEEYDDYGSGYYDDPLYGCGGY